MKKLSLFLTLLVGSSLPLNASLKDMFFCVEKRKERIEQHNFDSNTKTYTYPTEEIYSEKYYFLNMLMAQYQEKHASNSIKEAKTGRILWEDHATPEQEYTLTTAGKIAAGACALGIAYLIKKVCGL